MTELCHAAVVHFVHVGMLYVLCFVFFVRCGRISNTLAYLTFTQVVHRFATFVYFVHVYGLYSEKL